MCRGWLGINLIEIINEIMINLITSTGYVGIFLSMLIEGVLTPIPSELIIPFAGYLASTGQLNLILVILVGSIGACCGSLIAYFLGKRLGRPFLSRYGKYVGISGDDLCRADRWFAKWGNYGILIGHSLPGLRSIISFPAGIARMDVRRFALFTFLGAMIWNTVLAVAGYLLGSYWIEIAQKLDGWDLVIIAVVVLVFIAYVWNGRRKNRDRPHCKDEPLE